MIKESTNPNIAKISVIRAASDHLTQKKSSFTMNPSPVCLSCPFGAWAPHNELTLNNDFIVIYSNSDTPRVLIGMDWYFFR